MEGIRGDIFKYRLYWSREKWRHSPLPCLLACCDFFPSSFLQVISGVKLHSRSASIAHTMGGFGWCSTLWSIPGESDYYWHLSSETSFSRRACCFCWLQESCGSLAHRTVSQCLLRPHRAAFFEDTLGAGVILSSSAVLGPCVNVSSVCTIEHFCLYPSP